VDSVHRSFSGSIPEFYDRYLVPFYFTPFAQDLAERLRAGPDMRILELACGTGVVTQALAATLSGDGSIVATDLSDAMIDIAHKKIPDDRRVSWHQADATNLSFGDDTFDAVVCQFGWMFFPDRARAMRQAARVLRPGGRLLFNTWDSLDVNVIPAEAYAGVRSCFLSNPPTFYDIPYGMFDPAEHEELAVDAGFSEVEVGKVRYRGAELDPFEVATGVIRGGPFALEIEQRGADLDKTIETTAGRLRQRFGDAPFAAQLSALVCSATK